MVWELRRSRGLTSSNTRKKVFANVLISLELVYMYSATMVRKYFWASDEIFNQSSPRINTVTFAQCDCKILIGVFNCFSEPDEVTMALGELKKITLPVYISLTEMLTLMSQCQQLHLNLHYMSTQEPTAPVNRGILSNNPLTLLSGIIPGTKWCGTGDIAMDYFDLGAEPLVDRCCRAHDLCPVKVRAYSQRYNLTNTSLYTKSHCTCDDDLFDCLKESDSPTAHIMGNVYFNLVQVPCVEDRNDKRIFRKARNKF
ncbi:hypothetical protein FQR65_LT13881 [Abscondita terminalis]|nr:hypothetical protein FQR65_LT13881 [Abscondita terminalis]